MPQQPLHHSPRLGSNPGYGFLPALHGQAGFGMTQVRERLSTRYGTLASIEFGALAAGGTFATLKLPIDA